MLPALPPISTIILAAGLSERMGRLKMLLPYDHELTFYEKCVQTFTKWGCKNIISVVNEEGYKWIERQKDSFRTEIIVLNRTPGRGRFSSLQMGLHEANNDAPVFIHNIDNPFITIMTLQKIYLASIGNDHYDFISPRYRGRGGHPILISWKLADAIRRAAETDISLNVFLSGYTRRDVEVGDPGILLNINTMEDYTKAGLSLD